jgi:hypothetical protein
MVMDDNDGAEIEQKKHHRYLNFQRNSGVFVLLKNDEFSRSIVSYHMKVEQKKNDDL